MLSSERLHPAADSDIYRHSAKQWMELGDSYGRIGGKVEVLKGITTTTEPRFN